MCSFCSIIETNNTINNVPDFFYFAFLQVLPLSLKSFQWLIWKWIAFFEGIIVFPAKGRSGASHWAQGNLIFPAVDV